MLFRGWRVELTLEEGTEILVATIEARTHLVNQWMRLSSVGWPLPANVMHLTTTLLTRILAAFDSNDAPSDYDSNLRNNRQHCPEHIATSEEMEIDDVCCVRNGCASTKLWGGTFMRGGAFLESFSLCKVEWGCGAIFACPLVVSVWPWCSTFSRGEVVETFFSLPLSPKPTKAEMQQSITCARAQNQSVPS